MSDRWDFTPITWSPDDLKLAKIREMSLAELTRIYGVPLPDPDPPRCEYETRLGESEVKP